MAVRACSSASRRPTEQRFHERDIGHREQRGDFDAAVAADRDLSLRAGQRFLDAALAREPAAAGELQAGPLRARATRGARAARPRRSAASISATVAKRVPCTAAKVSASKRGWSSPSSRYSAAARTAAS